MRPAPWGLHALAGESTADSRGMCCCSLAHAASTLVACQAAGRSALICLPPPCTLPPQRECAWAIDRLRRCCEKMGSASLHCAFQPQAQVQEEPQAQAQAQEEAQEVGPATAAADAAAAGVQLEADAAAAQGGAAAAQGGAAQAAAAADQPQGQPASGGGSSPEQLDAAPAAQPAAAEVEPAPT